MNANPAICTVIAKNYIAFARVLSDSFMKYHPDGQVWVLVIDDFSGFIDPSEERFNVLSLEVLGIKNLCEFCFKYNVTELATAVKPYLMEYLLNNKKIEKLLYLDPDILVTAPLTQLFERLKEKRTILLTPHLDCDYPDDGKMPNDGHIMKSGIYNLGFIGIRCTENTLDFLRWWQTKLYSRCIIDFSVGYFVDQKFIDYAFPLFDGFFVIVDQGYNVAYWNLHSRKVERRDEHWVCNNDPLYFFHFSDFKPQRPDEISGHQNRFKLDQMPELKALFQYYIKSLEAQGYHKSFKWPYTYNYYKSGAEISCKSKIIVRNYGWVENKDPFSCSDFSLAVRFGKIKILCCIKKFCSLFENY